jgi:putative sporulation protein YtaF
MNIISIIIFAIAASNDNLIVGINYGAKKVNINSISNLIISLISGISTFLVMLLGKSIAYLISQNYANILGSGLIIFLGIYLLIDSLEKNNRCIKKTKASLSEYNNILKTPEIIDVNNSKNIESKEAIILGVILCLNNIGLGIGASITGLNPFITSLCSTLFSFIFISLGYFLGKKFFAKNFSFLAGIISAIIVIILGTYELFI